MYSDQQLQQRADGVRVLLKNTMRETFSALRTARELLAEVEKRQDTSEYVAEAAERVRTSRATIARRIS